MIRLCSNDLMILMLCDYVYNYRHPILHQSMKLLSKQKKIDVWKNIEKERNSKKIRKEQKIWW